MQLRLRNVWSRYAALHASLLVSQYVLLEVPDFHLSADWK